MLTPEGRSSAAIASSYFALLGLIPFCGIPFAILALMCGLLARREIASNPNCLGRGRAWFGIVMGGLEFVLSVIGIGIIVSNAAVPT